MKYIASCSFGKDSLAAIITRMEHNEPIDGAVYCRIMFDDETSAELPEHEDWIHGHAIPLLKARYGIETAVVQPKRTYCDCFYSAYETGGKVGRIYGFPFLRGPWCNTRLKTRPMKAWGKTIGEHTQLVGIAKDEEERAQKDTVKGKILPLVDHDIAENEAFDICKKANFLSPAYNGGRCRLGCWFCHNQRIGELRRLRAEYPALWNKLMALDKDSPVTFKPDRTLLDFDKRFFSEEALVTIFDLLERTTNHEQSNLNRPACEAARNQGNDKRGKRLHIHNRGRPGIQRSKWRQEGRLHPHSNMAHAGRDVRKIFDKG